MAGNGDKEALSLTPKALGAIVGAVVVAFGGGYVLPKTGAGEAQAGGSPCPSSSEMGQVRERLVAVEVTVVEMNKKLDSLVTREKQR